jgi:hypothetical protein
MMVSQLFKRARQLAAGSAEKEESNSRFEIQNCPGSWRRFSMVRWINALVPPAPPGNDSMDQWIQ